MAFYHNFPAVTTGNTHLIVAGGFGPDRRKAAVEVMDIEKLQWSTVASLPHPFSESTGHHLWRKTLYRRWVHHLCKRCRVSGNVRGEDLLQSQPQSLATRLLGRRSVWTEISPLPVILSSLVTFQGQLLAVGGTSTEPNAEVRQYDDSTDSWKVIGHMKVKLRNCLAAVLPNNALIVCGGYTPNGLTATVAVASLYQTAHSKILLPRATTK